MARIDFREHLVLVGQRPGMFGVEKRFRSAVAYVEGCDSATGRVLLDGMNEWLDGKTFNREGRGAVAWWGLVVYRRFPARYDNDDWDFSNEEEALLIRDLFAAVDEFLAERNSIFEISPAPAS